MNNITTQYGENKHLEYGWSSDVQEELFQLTYQLTRCNSQKMMELTNRLESIMKKIISHHKINIGKYQELMITAYKLIGYTRDVICGKGEYDLAYMQIIIWYKFYPNLAKYALRCFVQLDDGSHPYGSWKDIKYFCNYCINSGLNEDHQLIKYSLKLITDQLRKEEYDSIHTLVAKWVPREKSNKFGWLFEKLAILYFPEYMKTATTCDQKVRALRKAKTEYRRLISKLNETLQTVQIKQCNGRWSQIDHSRTTSITMHKQKRSFLNLNDNNLEDRIQCAKKLVELINDNSCKDINGKRIRLNDFTKDAIRMLRNDATTQVELDIINSQWRNSSNQTSKLGPMIAMLDCGNSMFCNDDGNPFYAALAIGCRIAEKSIFGKRILTFSSNPTWHNLEMCDTFTKMVKSIINQETGLSSNFEKALDLILDAYAEQQLDAEETNGITLAILSDMQINENEKLFELEILYEKIKENYSETGIKICGKPYKPPHILFWNFRSTSGFPCLSNTKNVSMISGYNPTFLNRFNEKDFKDLQATSPWLSLFESMNRERYKYMENKIKRELMFFE